MGPDDLLVDPYGLLSHGELFGGIRPATAMVEVRALIDPAMLVEIEADAIISD